MLQDTRLALFLLAELVAAPQVNDPDTIKWWQAQEHQAQQ